MADEWIVIDRLNSEEVLVVVDEDLVVESSRLSPMFAVN